MRKGVREEGISAAPLALGLRNHDFDLVVRHLQGRRILSLSPVISGEGLPACLHFIPVHCQLIAHSQGQHTLAACQSDSCPVDVSIQAMRAAALREMRDVPGLDKDDALGCNQVYLAVLQVPEL